MAETTTKEAVAEPKQDLIDNVDALQARMKEMRKAQKIFATYTQEQVDKIFFAAASTRSAWVLALPESDGLTVTLEMFQPGMM